MWRALILIFLVGCAHDTPHHICSSGAQMTYPSSMVSHETPSTFMRTKEEMLELGTLKDWGLATTKRKIIATTRLTAYDKASKKIIACVDKMATLPDSADMPVRDATELCLFGIKLKENN